MRWSRCGIGCSARSGKGGRSVLPAAPGGPRFCPTRGASPAVPFLKCRQHSPGAMPVRRPWLSVAARRPPIVCYRPPPAPSSVIRPSTAVRRRPPPSATPGDQGGSIGSPYFGCRVTLAGRARSRNDAAGSPTSEVARTAVAATRGTAASGARAPRHAVSISFACLRVVAVISRPPSIRATSSIRLARSSGTTVDTMPSSPSRPFATWK
ncbi:DNA repair protein RecN [Burkholderia oklahomensis]|uniref:DNA repair protein RecN n=1 Tax=Burkholderia oklahomensis TaxID=342113 RepID=A0AAI8B729_9BURK|nr:DNA repair protein RecN [Burkholderia oklahomensis]